jgi:hypothetical protein
MSYLSVQIMDEQLTLWSGMMNAVLKMEELPAIYRLKRLTGGFLESSSTTHKANRPSSLPCPQCIKYQTAEYANKSDPWGEPAD